MSNYKTQLPDGNILECGYDNRMDFVFVQVIDTKNEDYLYSNLNDMEINFPDIIDFEYFDEVLAKLNYEVPEELKIQVLKDRALKLSTFENIHMQIVAFYDENHCDKEKEDKFVVAIGQLIENKSAHENILMYEYYDKLSLAFARINQINGAFVDDIDDIKTSLKFFIKDTKITLDFTPIKEKDLGITVCKYDDKVMFTHSLSMSIQGEGDITDLNEANVVNALIDLSKISLKPTCCEIENDSSNNLINIYIDTDLAASIENSQTLTIKDETLFASFWLELYSLVEKSNEC